MSGGVDSSVAASVASRAGASVEGLFMKNWDEDDGTEYCTAKADYEERSRKSRIDSASSFIPRTSPPSIGTTYSRISLAEYRAGRTPNPDVLCNREIKFNVFIDYARTLSARPRIATGHYARSCTIGANGFELHKSIDPEKDQTYFLNAVPLGQLPAASFRLAN